MAAKSKYSKVFALVNYIKQFDEDYSHEQAVLDYSCGAMSSLRELDDNDLKKLEAMLEGVVKGNKQNKYEGDPKDRQRKAIIAIFKTHGKTVDDAKAWSFKQGVKGVHKSFNDYNGQELFSLTRMAEKHLRK